MYPIQLSEIVQGGSTVATFTVMAWCCQAETQYEPVLVIVYVLLLLTPIYPGSIAQYEERIRFCGNSDFAGSYRTPESEVIVHLVGSTKAYVYVSAIVGELAFSS